MAAILLATACWSSGGVIAKRADLPGVQLAFWRLAVVALIFAGLALATRRRITVDMVRVSLLGGLLFGVNLAAWFEALRHTTVGIATVTGALTPVVALVVGNRLLGERITPLALGCATAVMSGIVVFVVPSFGASGSSLGGIVLALIAITLWVSYLFATKQARDSIGSIEYLFCMAAVAAISLVPYLLIFTDEGLRPPTHGWGWLIALAVIPGSIGHGLLTWAQPHVPLSTSGILLQGEPVGAAIAGAIFLGESFGPLQAIGLAMVFAALAVLTRATTVQTPPTASHVLVVDLTPDD